MRKKSQIYLLEPRIMFDAAGAAVVETAVDSTDVSTDTPEVTTAPLVTMYSESVRATANKVEQSFQDAMASIGDFMQQSDAKDQMSQIFALESGAQALEGFDVLRDRVLSGNYSITIKILDAETMGVAEGAYAARGPDGEPVIYINGDWAAGMDSTALEKVMIEEIGHSFDTIFHDSADSVGDEGERFAALITGTKIEGIGADNDHYTMTVDGNVLNVELATFKFTNAYEMVYDLNNDGSINPAERWADKEQNSHYFNTTSLGTVTIDDNNYNSAYFSGNDVSAIGINIGGQTYYGWVSRPIKAGGIVRGFYFWTDTNFTNLATAQADGNQDGDSTVTDNRGFLLVVDQNWFNTQIATHTTYTINNAKDGNLGSVSVSNIGSSSDRVDSALNSLIIPNSVLTVTDSLTVAEDAANATGNLLTNDSDPNGDSFTLTSFNFTVLGTTYTYAGGILTGDKTIPGIGTINISSTGAYTFTPNGTYSGPVPVISYTITDTWGATSTSTFSINVTAVNDAPTANPDTNTVTEDTPINGNIISNDTDQESDTLSVTGFTYNNGSSTVSGSVGSNTITLNGVTVGVLVINANGTYTFSPASNYTGTIPQFTYSISDGHGGTASSTLTLTMSAVNDAPTANADNAGGTLYATAAGCSGVNPIAATTQTGNVLTNDTDPDITLNPGVTHQVTAVTSQNGNTWSSGTVVGLYGTLTIAADGTYTYNIDVNNATVKALTSSQTLTETFTYTMSEIGTTPTLLSSTSTLRIDIHGSNDRPTANDDFDTVNELSSSTTTNSVTNYGTAVGSAYATGVLGNDIDSDNATLTIGTITTTGDGTASFSSSPTSGSTSLSLAFTTTPASLTTSYYVYWQDGGASDATPILLYKDSAHTIYLNPSTVTGTGNNLVATLAVAGGYDSSGNYHAFAQNDYVGFANNLTGSGSGGNKYYEAQITSAPVTSSSTMIFNNVSMSSGSLSQGSTVTFTGSTTFTGTVTALTYDASGNISTFTVSTTNTVASGSYTINATKSVSAGTTIYGQYGKLDLASDGKYTYYLTSNALTSGQVFNETFTYTATDGTCTDTAVLTIRVTGTNTQIVDTSYTTLEDTSTGARTVNVGGSTISSFSYFDGTSTVSGSLVTSNTITLNGTTVGSLSLDSSGNYTFVPATNYNGPVPTITYVTATGSAATLSLTITPVNDAPAGTDKTVSLSDQQTYTFAVSDFGFSDPNDNPSNSFTQVKITTLPTNGTMRLNGSTISAGQVVTLAQLNSGSLVFTPTSNSATDPSTSFTFQVQDNGGTSNGGVDLDQSPNTFTFNVSQINDAPLNTLPASVSTNSYTSTGISVSTTDPDYLDSTRDINTVVLSVANGTLSLTSGTGVSLSNNGTGTVTLTMTGTQAQLNAVLATLQYTPTSTFSGTDTLTMTTTDDLGLKDIDSVNIAVSADNRTLSVTGTTVNEASPYVQFQVTGVSGQWISLALGTTGTGSGYATMGTDFLPNLQYYNGTAWVDYTGGMIQMTGTTLLVRTHVLQDQINEGAETLKLTATNQSGTAVNGNSTIIDNGTGSIFMETNNTSTPDSNNSNPNTGPVVLDDDRPISVNDITVNEDSPYAVFTLTGSANQWTKLSLSNGTATGGGTDFGPNLQYWNGSAWTSYTADSYIQLDVNGKLLVRTEIVDDNIFEGSETFFLNAQNTGGKSAYGMGTILDDGTGTKYPDQNPGAGPAPVTDTTSLDDDRTIAVVGGLTFNEGSTYATFTVTGMSGYEVNLALANGETNTATIAGFTYDYSVDGGTTWTTYTWNGTTGNRPMIPGSTTAGGNTGTVMVRVNITSEQESSNATDAYEGTENFKLIATYATNSSKTANATDSIIDDGSGIVDTDGDGVDNGDTKEDDNLPILTITDNNGASTGDETVAEDSSISSKTFTISTHSGVSSISIAGTSVTISQLNNISTTAIPAITTTEGVLTITGYDSGTGVVTYSYDPAGTHKDHTSGEVKDDISVSLTDTQGHTVSGTLTILITDTTPTANADTNTVTEAGSVSGNVLTDGTSDTFGADGAKITSPSGGVIGVRAGSDTSTVATTGADGTTNINGTYGYLTMNKDGSYTYHSTQGITADQTDTFVYTIEDSDGDRSTTTLTVSITNTTTLSISVNSVPLVNEGSTYALFMIFPSNSTSADSIDLTLQNPASGTAATWSGFTVIEYSTDGSNWTTYDASHKPVGGSTIYVRVSITSENEVPSIYEGPEKFGLKAAYTSDTTNNGFADTTIIDDGTGTKYTGTITGGNPGTITTNLDDDRILTVNNITVNEGDGTNYAIFSIGANAGQTMNLSLSNGSTNPTATSGTDYTNSLEYWDPTASGGSGAWTAYSAGFTMPGTDKSEVTLFVRVRISADNNFENAEDFKLTAAYTSGLSRSAVGVATIKDDGTGTKYTGVITGGNPVTDPTNLDDDRRPTANNDSTTVEEDSPVTITVLGNDSDPVGGGLTVTGTTNGTNGTVTIVGGNPIYTPNSGFTGTDTFTYTITDGNGHTSTATVTVTVTPKQQQYIPEPPPPVQPAPIEPPLTPQDSTVKTDLVITKTLEQLQAQSNDKTAKAYMKETEVAHSRNEDSTGIQVNNQGRVVLEFAGQHEMTQMNVVEVKAFQMDPKFVRIVVKDTQYKEGDAKFEMFALDGTVAPAWLKIDPRTGLITGIPPKGVEKVVVQVKIIGKDGKIKTVDVEINVVKKNSASVEGTLSSNLNHFASQYRSTDELISILNKTAKGA